MLLNELIDVGAAAHGGRVAVRFGTAELSFTEVDQLSRSIASLLAARAAPLYPKEVEDALVGHAQVAEALVIGVPSEQWGEEVAAFIVARGTPPDSAALIDHCRAFLAGYKLPKQIHFIDEIPKSAVGKPLRRAVREPFWAGRERRI
ncbi:AMP-binding enzyme [Sphingomonas alpina]|nr:hypothetical protein [Sphingomonas alpina]